MRVASLVAFACAGLIAGCHPSSAGALDLSPEVDLAASPDLTPANVFGGPCDANGNCPDGFICLPGPTSGSFCSKSCPANSSAMCAGAPSGTAAYCVVTNADPQGDKGCAFVCAEPGGKHYACPGQLVCETTDDPPGSGQRLCLPQ